jgi:hypothetical protein
MSKKKEVCEGKKFMGTTYCPCNITCGDYGKKNYCYYATPYKNLKKKEKKIYKEVGGILGVPANVVWGLFRESGLMRHTEMEVRTDESDNRNFGKFSP